MTSLVIIGRRWYQKSQGNTYHSVTIIINGKFIHKIGRTYGYGNQYKQTAEDWLIANGHIFPRKYRNGGVEPLWQYCERNGVNYYHEVCDVRCKSDL